VTSPLHRSGLVAAEKNGGARDEGERRARGEDLLRAKPVPGQPVVVCCVDLVATPCVTVTTRESLEASKHKPSLRRGPSSQTV
jgi:hypothetical protein